MAHLNAVVNPFSFDQHGGAILTEEEPGYTAVSITEPSISYPKSPETPGSSNNIAYPPDNV